MSYLPCPHADDEIDVTLSAHGILIDGGYLLLQQHPGSGRWQFPATTLTWEQHPESAISAFILGAAHLEIVKASLLYVDETCRVDASGRTGNRTRLFYYLQRGSNVAYSGTPADHRFTWMDVTTVTRAELAFGFDVLVAARLRGSVDADLTPPLVNAKIAAR